MVPFCAPHRLELPPRSLSEKAAHQPLIWFLQPLSPMREAVCSHLRVGTSLPGGLVEGQASASSSLCLSITDPQHSPVSPLLQRAWGLRHTEGSVPMKPSLSG